MHTFSGAFVDEETRCDSLIGAAFGHQLENVALARRQLGQPITFALPANDLRHDGGADH